MLDRALLYEILAKHGLSLDDSAFKRLDSFSDILVKTNESFNLTAITEPKDVTVKHFADSLILYKYVDFPKGAKIIDVGTGAGFPGLVLLLSRPDLKMTFLDSTRKKLGFIQSVTGSMGVSAEILHARAEDAGQNREYRERFDFAAARAVSNLTDLSEYCLPFVRKGGVFISMKSAEAEDEIKAAQKAIKLLGGETEKDILFDLVEEMPRRIILIKKKSQTPTQYPRPSAKIAKNPLK